MLFVRYGKNTPKKHGESLRLLRFLDTRLDPTFDTFARLRDPS